MRGDRGAALRRANLVAMLAGQFATIGRDDRGAGQPIAQTRAAIDQLADQQMRQKARNLGRIDVATAWQCAVAALAAPIVVSRTQNRVVVELTLHGAFTPD